jgi:hypothetical protein
MSSAASLAANNDYSLDLKHSVTPNSYIHPTDPSYIFNPAVVNPSPISTLKF